MEVLEELSKPPCMFDPGYLDDFPETIGELPAYIKETYLYHELGVVELRNVPDEWLDKGYEVIEDLEYYNEEFTPPCLDAETEEEFDECMEKTEKEREQCVNEIRKFIEKLNETKTPYLLYENSNSDFHVIRILIIQPQ